MLSSGRQQLKRAPVPAAIHREVALIQREDVLNSLALGEVPQREVRELRAEDGVLRSLSGNPWASGGFELETSKRPDF
jgi:hypothetical protein